MTNRGETMTDSEECDGSCITRPHTWSPSGARCIVCNVAGTGDPCGDGNCLCECDEEYGPCEEHGTTIVQREGASTRTADDLLLLFCLDAVDVIVDATGDEDVVTPWGQDVLQDAERLLDENDSHGCRWFPEEDEGRTYDTLVTLQYQLEAQLATLDQEHRTYWDDGYRIVRVEEGCPLLDD